jgi:uncharacterized protein YndB with AHSA1/START domain
MKAINVSITVSSNVKKAWDVWNSPEHIKHWAFASDDWEVGEVAVDLRVGGSFQIEMRAKDGSEKFDFVGIYSIVDHLKQISYSMPDGRKVEVNFEAVSDDVTMVTEVFDMENENSEELQRAGWQSILGNYKKYLESI